MMIILLGLPVFLSITLHFLRGWISREMLLAFKEGNIKRKFSEMSITRVAATRTSIDVAAKRCAATRGRLVGNFQWLRWAHVPVIMHEFGN